MINFAPLGRLKTTSFPWWVGVIIVGAIIIGLASGADSIVIPLVAVPAIIIGHLMQASQTRTHNKAIYEAFAAANGFSYAADGDKTDQGPGTLFLHGQSPETTDIITGIRPDGLAFSILHHNYDTGSGKSRTTHEATVARVKLPRVLPHMVIDSHVEGGANNSSVLPIEFDRSQRIELEGDFNKYFSCYAPDKYGISLLTVIGPDVMWVLMEHAAACDIEIIDDNLYFYWPLAAEREGEYENIFNTIDNVLKEIGPKLTTADIYATKEQARVHTSEVARQGVRLSSHKNIWGGAALGIFVLLWMGLHSGVVPMELYIFAIFGLIFGGLLLGLWHHMQAQALKEQLNKRFGK